MKIQNPPQPDKRYRVHRSAKCYVASLACGTTGCTWYFDKSIERVVYMFPGRIEKVQYKNSYYPLKPAEELKILVARQLAMGGAISLGGKYLAPHELENDFLAFPFIDVSSSSDRDSYDGFLRSVSS